jgi:hypothetical protein
MPKATCHCENVVVRVQALAERVTRCNCSICRRYAPLWGYHTETTAAVQVGEHGLRTYCWGDRMVNFHQCGQCGCVTHYTRGPEGDGDRLAVNYRLFEAETVDSLPVRDFDGANWGA